MATTSATKTVGIDLGDRKSSLCIIDAEGTVFERLTLRTTQKRLCAYFENIEPVRIVLEAGTHSTWVSEVLGELEHEVIVANPRRVHLIARNNHKSDRVDAELLARLGRLDPQLLAPITHRRKGTRAFLSVIRGRKTLIEVRSKLINHVRGSVKSFGARLPSCTSERFAKQARVFLPKGLTLAVEPILKVLDETNAEIKKFDACINSTLREALPEMDLLEQVNGVGPITAATFILTLEDASRFRSSRSVGSYLGLTPRRSQSGDQDPQLRITKAGDVYLRKLLVNCAQYILGPFGQASDLRTWGLALAVRGGSRPKRRAVVAVARRLAVLLHRLWRTGEAYVPVGYQRAPAPG